MLTQDSYVVKVEEILKAKNIVYEKTYHESNSAIPMYIYYSKISEDITSETIISLSPRKDSVIFSTAEHFPNLKEHYLRALDLANYLNQKCTNEVCHYVSERGLLIAHVIFEPIVGSDWDEESSDLLDQTVNTIEIFSRCLRTMICDDTTPDKAFDYWMLNFKEERKKSKQTSKNN